MAITQTTVIPKTVIGEDIAIAIYAVTFDTSYPTGGEALDCTDFSLVRGIEHVGSTALADNGYAIRAVFPRSTTPSSSNCLLSVWQNWDPAGAGSADRVDVEYPTGTDLVANLAGPVMILVIGR